MIDAVPALEAWRSRGRRVTCRTARAHEVFVVDGGDANAAGDETLVLMHGFPESSYSYAGAFDLLLRRFRRVVAFDFLGFGFSDKPRTGFTYSIFEHADVALDLLKQLDVKAAHMLAHDMGDSVLTELLARVREHRPYWLTGGFQSVTFTNGGMVRAQTKFRVGQKVLLSPWGRHLGRVLESPAIFRRQILSAHGNDRLSQAQLRDMHQAITQHSWSPLIVHLTRYQNERLRFEAARWLPAIRDAETPVHICWGTDDRVNPTPVAEHLTREVRPDASLTLVDGLGHFAQIQDPQRWVAALAPFWDRSH